MRGTSKLLMALGLLAACGEAGSGIPKEETRTPGTFHAVHLDGVGTLVLRPGKEPRVTVRGDDNFVGRVATTVSDGVLQITSPSRIRPKVPLRYTVEAPALDAVTLDGAGKVEAEGLTGPRFRLLLDGAARARLAGQVETAEIEVSGAGKVDARALRARRVTVELSGAGSATVFASERLEATISGAGHVRYAGHPKEVVPEVSGAGSVKPLEGP